MRNPLEVIIPKKKEMQITTSKEEIINYEQYENYILILSLIIAGLILFLLLVYIIIYCMKEAIKAKERYDREEYLKALEHHKQMVWAVKNKPEPAPLAVPIAENTLIKTSISQGYIQNKNLRPLSPSSSTNVE